MALALVLIPAHALAVVVVTLQQTKAGTKKQEKPDENFLDLTRHASAAPEAMHEEQVASGTIEAGGGPGMRRAELPLRVTLLSLDRESYMLGETGFFEIALENIGSEVVNIPWSPDSSIGVPSQERAVPGNSHAVISLLIGRTPADGKIVDVFGLYGSEFVHGSLKRLEPGQKVRIRVPFAWRFFEEEAPAQLLKHPAQRQNVRAQIFLNSNRITHAPAVSANNLVVKLEKR